MLSFKRIICLFIILSVVLTCLQLGYLRLPDYQTWRTPVWEPQHDRRPPLLSPRVPCLGARGKLLNESIDDQLLAEELPGGKYDGCI
jgi:hypothetical protein